MFLLKIIIYSSIFWLHQIILLILTILLIYCSHLINPFMIFYILMTISLHNPLILHHPLMIIPPIILLSPLILMIVFKIITNLIKLLISLSLIMTYMSPIINLCSFISSKLINIILKLNILILLVLFLSTNYSKKTILIYKWTIILIFLIYMVLFKTTNFLIQILIIYISIFNVLINKFMIKFFILKLTDLLKNSFKLIMFLKFILHSKKISFFTLIHNLSILTSLLIISIWMNLLLAISFINSNMILLLMNTTLNYG